MGVVEDGFSVLLEFAASDNLDAFRSAVANPNSGLPVDQLGLWYTRQIGSNKMSYELRTPLMVAALYGSVSIVDYIIRSGKSDVNRVAGSDRVTALHCAVVGGSVSAASVVDRLIAANADANLLDGNGRVAAELIPRFAPKKQLENLLYLPATASSSPATSPERQRLPDINNGVYGSDEFRMYSFKIKPCSRAYTHDWTECPFAHPGENARRRDPTKYQYTCVPCPDFKKGSCKKSDECEFAHGVFESWLHPAQYRTRLCKDETGCSRKVCFFAHRREELRPVYQSTGSAIPGPDMGMSPPPSQSPKRSSAGGVTWQGKSSSPPSLQLPGSRLRSSLNARDIELIKIEIQQQQQTHNFLQHNQIMSPRQWDLSPAPRGFESSSAILNSRASAFAQRSQSFGGYGGGNGVAQSNSVMAEWGSPKGRAEWGVQGDELNKLRKSNSFGLRGNDTVVKARTTPLGFHEPDVSWVSSLVKEEGHEVRSQWGEQLYMDQQLLA